MNKELTTKTIVFFDGECMVCNRFVLLLLLQSDRLDFYYAPLFGQTFRELQISKKYLDSDSIVFYKHGDIYLHASAIELISKELGGVYKIIYWILKFTPNILSNSFYKFFARIRYSLFKRIGSCSLIPKEHQQRILS